MATALDIRAKLSSRGATPAGNRVKIKCPWHAGGNERTASLFVNVDDPALPPGTFHCFGCTKHGGWKSLAIKLGFIADDGSEEEDSPFASTLPNEVMEKLLTEEEINEMHQILAGEKKFPSSRNWRGIDGNLLRKIGAKITKINSYEPRVYLPIIQHGVWRSGIYCSWKRNASLKYENEAGMPTSQIWFPYDYVRKELKKRPKNKRVVLLGEGPRDALNPMQHGILTLANIGGSTIWSETKVDLLIELEATHIVTGFDPDRVGKELTNIVRRDLASYYAKIPRFKMYKTQVGNKVHKEDLGNLSPKRMSYLKQCLEKL